jgi:hypothetical protein
MAVIRSAQGIDCSVFIPVRVGTGDSFHLVEHRQVQLVGWTRSAVGCGAAHVDTAGYIQALGLFVDGSGEGIDPPLPDATARSFWAD